MLEHSLYVLYVFKNAYDVNTTTVKLPPGFITFWLLITSCCPFAVKPLPTLSLLQSLICHLSLYFCFSRISYKQNYTVHSLLSLASFTLHGAFEVTYIVGCNNRGIMFPLSPKGTY